MTEHGHPSRYLLRASHPSDFAPRRSSSCLAIDLIASEDEGDGCGTVGGVSQILNEAAITAGEDPLFAYSYPSQGVFELRLDGRRDLEGVLVFGQFQGVAGNPVTPGAGKTDVELTFTGKIGSQFISFGTATGTATVTPGTGEYEVPFTLDLDDELHGDLLTELTVDVVVRGVAVNQDFQAYPGDSLFTVPTLDLVEVTSEG